MLIVNIRAAPHVGLGLYYNRCWEWFLDGLSIYNKLPKCLKVNASSPLWCVALFSVMTLNLSPVWLQYIITYRLGLCWWSCIACSCIKNRKSITTRHQGRVGRRILTTQYIYARSYTEFIHVQCSPAVMGLCTTGVVHRCEQRMCSAKFAVQIVCRISYISIINLSSLSFASLKSVMSVNLLSCIQWRASNRQDRPHATSCTGAQRSGP